MNYDTFLTYSVVKSLRSQVDVCNYENSKSVHFGLETLSKEFNIDRYQDVTQ